MRRRLLRIYTTLVILVVLGLEIPLGALYAMDEFHHVAVARLNDTARFAALATFVLKGDEASETEDLRAQFRTYERDTGAEIVLLNARRSIVLASSGAIRLRGNADWQAKITAALHGQRDNGMDYPYNIHALPLFLAEPVVSGSGVLGVVVTISPMTQLRSKVARGVLLLITVGLVAIASAVAVGMPFTRWILGPVQKLDKTARTVAAGHYEIRAPVGSGPPEIRGLAQAFNTMADRLVSMVGAQRAFVGDASHQLRGPLTALLLRLENLEASAGDDCRNELAVTIAEGRRLSRILDDLLTLTRTERGLEIPGVVDVTRTCHSQADVWAPKAAARGVRIAVETDGVSQLAVCAPDAFSQVLDVLLDNALDFTPAGQTVRIVIQPARDTLTIHVIDAGPGMTEETKARAKDRFWRGDSSETREGSGLGLAIADALVTANRGSLTLADAVPHGLDAQVTLLQPAGAGAAVPACREPAQGTATAPSSAKGKLAGFRTDA